MEDRKQKSFSLHRARGLAAQLTGSKSFLSGGADSGILSATLGASKEVPSGVNGAIPKEVLHNQEEIVFGYVLDPIMLDRFGKLGYSIPQVSDARAIIGNGPASFEDLLRIVLLDDGTMRSRRSAGVLPSLSTSGSARSSSIACDVVVGLPLEELAHPDTNPREDPEIGSFKDEVLAAELPADVVTWECQICFSSIHNQGWSCPDSHRYCSDCMRCHVDNVFFARCPFVGCGHELVEADLLFLKVSDARLTAFREAKLHNAMDTLVGPANGGTVQADCISREAVVTDDIIRCPNSACRNAVLVASGERLRYVCSCGTAPFCTRCRQTPYHYHAPCAEVQSLRRQWFDWISGGRDKYHGHAHASSVYEAQLSALREGLDRHEELEGDESWKVEHCRLCPKCRRPIQKTAGCDVVICGSDYHGGNQQNGCGTKFNWDKALPYKARVESRPLPKVVVEEVRCRGATTLHAFVACSFCKGGSRGKGPQGIVGPRFRCIHCASFDVCIECEPHLAKLHDPSHVFEIVFESDFDWASLRLPHGTRVRIVRRGTQLPVDASVPNGCCIEGVLGTVTRLKPTLAPQEPAEAYEWQADPHWEGESGRWHRYDAATLRAIQDAVRKGQRRVQLTVGGRRYELDLLSMCQRSMATGVRRAVRAARAASEAVAGRAYRVKLDAGGDVTLSASHLDPVLVDREDATRLIGKALAMAQGTDYEDS